MSRLACGIAVIASLLPGFALAGDPNVDVQVQVVDAMNKVFGFHPGFRAVHSKGIVVKGKFIGTTEGAELSKAELFAGNAIPVTVRFRTMVVFRRYRTDRSMLIHTVWPSSSTCRTAAKPTW